MDCAEERNTYDDLACLMLLTRIRAPLSFSPVAVRAVLLIIAPLPSSNTDSMSASTYSRVMDSSCSHPGLPVCQL